MFYIRLLKFDQCTEVNGCIGEGKQINAKSKTEIIACPNFDL